MTFSRSGPLVPEPSTAAAEKDLVRLAQTGDTEARDELARRHRQPAYFLALQLLGNADDALDVAQDAMLRFFTTLHRFDASRPVRPWLFQIVRNRVLDLYRRRKVRKHDSIEQAADDDDRPNLELVDTSVDLERDVAQTELQQRLWRALGEVSHAQREILVLRDYQDLSYSEIAKTLDIPIGTVMSRLHGARKHLRAVLQDDLRTLLD